MQEFDELKAFKAIELCLLIQVRVIKVTIKHDKKYFKR